MSEERSRHLTRLLRSCGSGAEPAPAVLEEVYDELRSIARARMASERAGHTLQATALVHEAYLRLVGDQPVAWRGRGHFYGAAAEAMRRILVDHARRAGSQKRGGAHGRVTLGAADAAHELDTGDVPALDEALTALEGEDPRAARVVRLRYFAGLSVEEIARALEVSTRTVHREWTFARTRLFELLSGDPEP